MELLILLLASTETLTLERALELARGHHQTGAIARARVERAEANRALALSALLPEVSLFARYTRQPERRFETELIQEENVVDGRAALNLSLLEAKSFVQLSRAKPAFEAERLGAEEAVRALDFEVARLFLAVLSAEGLAASARNRIAVALKAKEDARKRLEHGLSGDNDLTRAELELATAELVAADAEASIRALRLQLERYVGAPARAPLRAPAELLSVEQSFDEEAAEQRPDLARLRAEAEASEIAAAEPLWGLVPSLSLDAYYELTTQQAFAGENEASRTEVIPRSQDGESGKGWGVSLSARWTLYDRGRRYREADERAAASRVAALELERAREDAASEIQQGLVQLDRAKVSLARAETLAALAAKNAEEVAIRYREGVASAFEVADANAREFTARVELERARFELGLSLLSLRESTGADVL